MVRLGIFGTPRTGNTWVRRILADVLHAEEIPVHHPADADWEHLPDRFVMQLHWHRTAKFEELLSEYGVQPISVGRLPTDVLLSVLTFFKRDKSVLNWLQGEGGSDEGLEAAEPGDEAFMAWATGPRAEALLSLTPEWWSSPRTCRARYEDLVRDPLGSFKQIFERLELPDIERLEGSLSFNSADRIHELSGGVHVWRAKPGAGAELLSEEARNRIYESHEKVFSALGYSAG